MSSWATELFGASLLTKAGVKPTAEALAGTKFVALYYSAHVRAKRARARARARCCSCGGGRATAHRACCSSQQSATHPSPSQWCGPCRKFTPLLAVTYDDQADKNEVEVRRRAASGRGERAGVLRGSHHARTPPPPPQIVFVSMDEDADKFEEYYAEQPWAALPFDSPLRESIPDKFGVSGIPHVVVLSGATGAVVSTDARALITAKKTLTGIFA